MATAHQRAAIYARVSTFDQEPENQLQELRRYVEARGWTGTEYIDKVRFMRNLLARVPQSLREPVAAIVRTIFAQPDHASALAQLQKVADGLRKRLPATAALLDEAVEDILAHKHYPDEHRRQLHSTKPLERLNKEIKRRANVVDIFPNVRALVRLVGAILL